jgi:hypothetical protein
MTAPIYADQLTCFEVATSALARLESIDRISDLGVEVRVEAGRVSVICLDAGRRPLEADRAALVAVGLEPSRSWAAVARDRLVVVRGARRVEAEGLGRVLALAGRRALVELAPERSLDDPFAAFHAAACGVEGPSRLSDVAEPAGAAVVLARAIDLEAARLAAGPISPALTAAVDRVDTTRWLADVTTLAGWNRWTRGTQILSARDWLVARFGELPGMQVTTASFPVTTHTGWNVFARLPGTVDPASWYLVGGHYDSTSQSPATAAPGAEDNASGCTGVLELARAFAGTPPPRTILFACYAGEEQGLYGSYDHADDLQASGEDTGYGGGLILDMIGYTGDAELDVLLESEPVGQPLIDAFAASAADFTTLAVEVALNAWGSDHVPYLEAVPALPAMLAIENDWDDYPDYHRTTDLPGSLSTAMGGGILRMGAGGIGRLAGLVEPVGLLFRDGWERGDASAWSLAGEE